MTEFKTCTKTTEGYNLEALDRVANIQDIVERQLGHVQESDDLNSNDGCHYGIWNHKCKTLLKDVGEKLAELYQEIGQWESSESELKE